MNLTKIALNYKIRKINNLFNLNDIINTFIKPKNFQKYINNIIFKRFIGNCYFIENNIFYDILINKNNKICKEAIKLLENSNKIKIIKNNLIDYFNERNISYKLLKNNVIKLIYYNININLKYKFNKYLLNNSNNIFFFINNKNDNLFRLIGRISDFIEYKNEIIFHEKYNKKYKKNLFDINKDLNYLKNYSGPYIDLILKSMYDINN